MSWLSGWTYRKSITLSRASGAVTNYPMKVLVGESAGASGCDVQCGGHCLSSFNDLRFTKSDGTTLLDYWSESISVTSPNRVATVWVEFDSIGTSETTFYLYYGNTEASAVSNGANTFTVFDDYEWGSDGTDLATSGGSVTYNTPNNGSAISTDRAYGGTRSVELPYHADLSFLGCSTTVSDALAVSFRFYMDSTTDAFYFSLGNATYTVQGKVSAGSLLYYDTDYHDTGANIVGSAWNQIELKNFAWSSGTFDMYLNGVNVASAAMETLGDYENVFGSWGSDVEGESVWFDNLIARPWHSVEPAWGSWGAEELRLAENFERELDESVSLAESGLFLERTTNPTATDTIFIYEKDLISSWVKQIADSLELTDSGDPILAAIISEWLWLVDSQANNWSGTQIVPTEILNLYDLPSGPKVINRSIAESIGLADTITIQFLVRVLESMGFSDLLAAIGIFNHSAADTLNLTDAASKAYEKLISEVLSLVDVCAVITTFLPSISELLGIADISSTGLFASKTVSDGLIISDTAGSGLHAFNIVQDAITLNVILEIDGELYECYVLNTPKFFPSVYSGFDFNSYCCFEGKAYGANASGIYELTGDTDAGATIKTGVVMPQTTFGIPDSKKLRRAWLGISGDAPVLVLEVEDGTRRAYTIDSYGEVGSDRDISGKKWKLTVANFDELDFIKILPVALAR